MDSLLEALPLRPPPPGLQSNFIDPPSRQSQIVAVAIALPTLALALLSLRIYTRAFVSRAFGIDDVLAICAMLASIALSYLVILNTRYGLGRHDWDIPLKHFRNASISGFASTAVFYLAAFLVKLSVLALYLRIFSSSRSFKRTTYAVIAFIFILLFTFLMLHFLQCIPLRTVWTLPPEPAHCFDRHRLLVVGSVLNALTDLLILCLPIPVVARLQLPARKKISIIAIFASGCLATAVAFVRIGLMGDGVAVSRDVHWFWGGWIMWGIAEMNIGLIACCLPTLRPLGNLVGTGIWTFSSSRNPCASGPSTASSRTLGLRKPSIRHQESDDACFIHASSVHVTDDVRIDTTERANAAETALWQDHGRPYEAAAQATSNMMLPNMRFDDTYSLHLQDYELIGRAS